MQAAQEAILPEEIVGYETMLESDPDNVTQRSDVALLYVRSKDVAEAARHFAAVVKLQPQSAAAHYNLGNVQLLLQQMDAAARRFETAVGLQADYAPAHHGLGLVRQADPRTLPQAAVHLQRAVQLAPESAEIRHHFAITLRRLGRVSEAVREYREVLRIDPARSGAAGDLAAAERELAAAAKPSGQ